jgi:hypothetical protein
LFTASPSGPDDGELPETFWHGALGQMVVRFFPLEVLEVLHHQAQKFMNFRTFQGIDNE